VCSFPRLFAALSPVCMDSWRRSLSELSHLVCFATRLVSETLPPRPRSLYRCRVKPPFFVSQRNLSSLTARTKRLVCVPSGSPSIDYPLPPPPYLMMRRSFVTPSTLETFGPFSVGILSHVYCFLGICPPVHHTSYFCRPNVAAALDGLPPLLTLIPILFLRSDYQYCLPDSVLRYYLVNVSCGLWPVS